MTEVSDNNKNLNGVNRTKKIPLDAEFLPANKHAPTPLEKQRAQVAKLLQNPTREIHLPKAPKDKSIRPPREMMKNVQGSSAGAGSGEFHVYKQSRRREYERLRLMDENEEKDRLKTEFEKKQAELKQISESKTNKNRMKRQKKKEMRKKKQAKLGPKNDPSATAQGGRKGDGEHSGGSDSSDESDSDEVTDGNGHGKKKRAKLGAAPIADGMVFKRPNPKADDDSDNDKPDQDKNSVEDQKDDANAEGDYDLSTSVPVVSSVGLTIVEDEW